MKILTLLISVLLFVAYVYCGINLMFIISEIGNIKLFLLFLGYIVSDFLLTFLSKHVKSIY